MCSSGELLVEASCRLARRPAWVRGGRGTGTATLESKLAQQLVGLAHEPLFQMFLDIRKVYDSLDRERCLDIFSGYGVRPNITCLLKSYWER